MSKDANEVRRKLLKAMVYAPPVILGSMVATPRTVMGAIGQVKTCTVTGGPSVIITISSGTNACCPCVVGSDKFIKDGGTVDPVTGAVTYPKKCLDSQCIKSCGVNCAPGQIAAIKCKKFCKVCGTTPVGCTKPCKTGCLPDPKKPGKFKCK